jgi:hypothetical protein
MVSSLRLHNQERNDTHTLPIALPVELSEEAMKYSIRITSDHILMTLLSLGDFSTFFVLNGSGGAERQL